MICHGLPASATHPDEVSGEMELVSQRINGHLATNQQQSEEQNLPFLHPRSKPCYPQFMGHISYPHTQKSVPVKPHIWLGLLMEPGVAMGRWITVLSVCSKQGEAQTQRDLIKPLDRHRRCFIPCLRGTEGHWSLHFSLVFLIFKFIYYLAPI